MDKKVIAVIFGGQSSEHDVSKMSAATVMAALDEDKYFVLPIYISRTGHWFFYDGPKDNMRSLAWEKFALPAILSPDAGHRGILRLVGDKFKLMHVDVIIPVLHGKNGEDGTMQGLFELSGIPYVGSGVLSSALSMDKSFTNMLADKLGIKRSAYKVFNKQEIDADIDAVCSQIRYKLGYPCFVKPANTGSSVGITMPKNKKELIASIHEALQHDDKIIVEKRVVGRELECAVLGNSNPQASGVGEIVFERDFYCYDAKYDCEASKTIITADLPADAIKNIQDISLKIYTALGCKGLARVDFFYTEDGEVLFNEINTLPGFTSISMYPKLWREQGLQINELVDKLISLALEEK